MTEPELSLVLSGRFNVAAVVLNDISHPDFPKKLFESKDRESLAMSLLLIIFDRSIIAGDGLCDAEKAIVREVRSWVEKSNALIQVAYMFLEHEISAEKSR